MREEERLKKIVAEQFAINEEDLNGDLTFDELALDSLEWMELAVTIEEEFDIQLADVDLRRIQNLGQMAEIILERIRE